MDSKAPMTDSTDIEGLVALRAASGYLLNAKIDLETGAPKATAIRTIEGGLKVVQTAIASAEAKLAAAIGEGMGTCHHCGGKLLTAISATEKGAAS